MVLLAADAKTALGVVAVVLALVGGCGARRDSATLASGSISGHVAVEGLDGLPASPAGWKVAIPGQALGATVDSSGSFVVGGVPPGTYVVQLTPAVKEAMSHVCSPAACRFEGVTVLSGLATVHVDFGVMEVPAPPF